MAKIIGFTGVVGMGFSFLISSLILSNRMSLDLLAELRKSTPDYIELINLVQFGENILIGILSLPVSAAFLATVMAALYIQRPKFYYLVLAVIELGFIVGMLIIVYKPSIYKDFLKSILKSKVIGADLCTAVGAEPSITLACCPVGDAETCIEEILDPFELRFVMHIFVWGTFAANLTVFAGALFAKKGK